MSLRQVLTLIGIILGAVSATFNSQVTANAIGDVSGALFLSHDQQTWFNSLYTTVETLGMALSPWLLVTFSLRQFTLWVFLLNVTSSVLIPFSPEISALYILRAVQGLSEGLTIPLLFTTALRVLNPAARLYGFAVYALTATFIPAIATTMAAFWTTAVTWQFVFLEAVPLCTGAGLLIWFGEKQDPPRYERFRKFDWRGALLVAIGFGSLSTMLQQGDRFDWFNSPFICVLAVVSVIAIPLLLVNEWFHELPLFKLQILGRPNFAYGAIALLTFIIIGQSASTVPNEFFRQVQGFRPEQFDTVTLVIALPQLVLLPLVAYVLDFEQVDGRAVSFLGLALIFAACVGASYVTPDWYPRQFYVWQALQAVGQPMVVMPLLMLAAGAVRGPEEAPLASGLVNTPRAIAEAAGVWLLQLIQRWRGGLHYNRLADQAGLERFRLLQAERIPPYPPPPLMPDGRPIAPGSLDALQRGIEQQARVLTISDTYLILAGFVVFLMAVLLILPNRELPPRIVAARKKQAAS